MNRLIATAEVVDLDEQLARKAATLRTAVRGSGVVDAVVVATADLEPRSVVLTGDADDLRPLAAVRGRSRVLPL